MSNIGTLSLVCVIALTLAAGPALAADAPTSMPAVSAAVKAKADASLARGAKFLLGQQGKDGRWGEQYATAMTALAVKALLDAGQPIDSAAIKAAVKFIVDAQIKDDPKLKGSFAAKELSNYTTAICLSTLAIVNARLPGKPYDEQIKLGLEYLRRDQWDESEGIDKNNPAYGGFGYGSGARPDMSNTSVAMDALRALQEAGYVDPADPMYKKVQEFLTRSQNRSESNKAGTFAVGDDGGFIYTPAASPTKGGAESKAGPVKLEDGRSGLRSYGSMTYAGFKSYVYSGLSKKDDPRVAAAFKWICENYSLTENPGVGPEGLFYYYHVMARALRASGEPRIKDAANVSHDWRAELVDKLASLQGDDGSWRNEKAPRWEEGDPVLATCFAMLAMGEVVR